MLTARLAPSSAGLFTAATATTSEMYVVILDLEFAGFDFRPGNPIEARILNIDDAPTTKANQMMMLVELGVEARGRTGVARPGYQAERNKCP